MNKAVLSLRAIVLCCGRYGVALTKTTTFKLPPAWRNNTSSIRLRSAFGAYDIVGNRWGTSNIVVRCTATPPRFRLMPVAPRAVHSSTA